MNQELQDAERELQADSDRSVQMLASVIGLGILVALLAVAFWLGGVL